MKQIKLNAAHRLTADWWSDLGSSGQEVYIEEHPKSKKAKEAFEEEQEDTEVETKPKKQKALSPGRPLAFYAKSKDDPDITVDKIFSKFSEDDVAEMKSKTKEAMQLEPTDHEYVTSAGDYTPERQALHAKILKRFLSPEKIKAATPPAGTKPTFIVLGGRGGSGKSAFTDNEETGEPAKLNEFDSKKFLTLDADAIKQLLDPPYEGWNANQVHEESSYLFDKIADMAENLGLNIISDATLKSDKMGPVLKGLQDKGYDIEGHYMFLPRQKAAARACGRYLKSGPDNRGRLVPPAVILGNTKNEENFDKLKGFFKKWSCYDNDQPKGSPPQLIDHSDFASKTEARAIKASMKTQVRALQEGTTYTTDDWENDPYLRPDPKRAAKILKDSFKSMKQMGIKPEQIKDAEKRKAYTTYLRSK